MTVQERDQWLLRYRQSWDELGYYRERVIELEALATHITATLSPTAGVSGSGESHRLEGVACRIAAAKQEYAARTHGALDALLAIESAISAVPDARYRRLLRLRYIDGLQWSDVARELHCSRSGVFQHREDALLAIPEAAFS